MMAHFEVHKQLDADELAELEAFAREPARTVDQVHEWLLSRGYTMARSSAGRWMTDFRKRLQAERFGRSAELARAIDGAINRDGIEAVAKGASKQLLQVVFEQAAMLESEGQVDPLDVQRWSRSLKTLIESERHTVKLTDELAELKRKQTAAVAAAEKARASGGDVVAVIKEALGIG